MRIVKTLASKNKLFEGDVNESFLESLKAGIKPENDLNFIDFSNTHIIIPRESGSRFYGKFSTDYSPHVEEVMRALDIDSPYIRVAVQGCAQSWKTQTALNFLLYLVNSHPKNVLYLSPSGTLQKRLINRLDKFIVNNSCVNKRFANPGTRSSSEQNNSSLKSFKAGTLFLGSANSPNSLSEVPAPYVFMDEIDRYEDDVAGEGDPITLAEKRATSFGKNVKFYLFSTPTLETTSKINRAFKKGTKQTPLAECIHCSSSFPIEFEDLKIDDEANAYVACPDCGGIHYEYDKPKMFANGLWTKPSIEFDGETASFRFPATFLPYGSVSWQTLIFEHREAINTFEEKGTDGLLRAFLNTRMALTYSEENTTLTSQKIIDDSDSYEIGIAPLKTSYIVNVVDTQDNRFVCLSVGFAHGLECFVFDHAIIHGSPDDFETQKNLHLHLTRDIQHESGVMLKADINFIDSGGHFTKHIYSFCYKNRKSKFIPIKGSSKLDADPIDRATKIKIEGSSATVMLYLLGINRIKDYLYQKIKNKPATGKIHFTNNLSNDFFEELVSEYKTVQVKNGKPVSRWIKKQGMNNESWDLLTYAMACAYHLGIHRMTENFVAKRRKKLKLDTIQEVIEEIEEREEIPEIKEEEIKQQPQKKSRIRRRQGSIFNSIW